MASNLSFGLCILLICLSPLNAKYCKPGGCAPNAHLDSDSNSCICDAGYQGLGYLTCEKKSDFKTCSLNHEGRLTLSKADRVQPFLPCFKLFFRMAEKNFRCLTQVDSQEDIADDGSLSSSSIFLSLAATGKQIRLQITEDNRLKHISSTRHEYKPTNGDVLDMSDGIKTITLGGTTFTFTYTAGVWQISGCDVVTTFRNRKGSKANPNSRPGLSVRYSPKGHVFSSVCKLKDMIKKDDAYTDPMMTLSMFYTQSYTQTNQEAPEVCKSIKVSWGSCGFYRDRYLAVETCEPLFRNETNRECLMSHGVSFTETLDLYLDCLNFTYKKQLTACRENFDHSIALQECLPSYCDKT